MPPRSDERPRHADGAPHPPRGAELKARRPTISRMSTVRGVGVSRTPRAAPRRGTVRRAVCTTCRDHLDLHATVGGVLPAKASLFTRTLRRRVVTSTTPVACCANGAPSRCAVLGLRASDVDVDSSLSALLARQRVEFRSARLVPYYSLGSHHAEALGVDAPSEGFASPARTRPFEHVVVATDPSDPSTQRLTDRATPTRPIPERSSPPWFCSRPRPRHRGVRCRWDRDRRSARYGYTAARWPICVRHVGITNRGPRRDHRRGCFRMADRYHAIAWRSSPSEPMRSSRDTLADPARRDHLREGHRPPDIGTRSSRSTSRPFRGSHGAIEDTPMIASDAGLVPLVSCLPQASSPFRERGIVIRSSARGRGPNTTCQAGTPTLRHATSLPPSLVAGAHVREAPFSTKRSRVGASS